MISHEIMSIEQVVWKKKKVLKFNVNEFSSIFVWNTMHVLVVS